MQAAINVIEENVPDYELPDLLSIQGGKRVKNIQDWREIQRPHLLEIFSREVYGKVPNHALEVTYKPLATNERAIDGLCIRKEVCVEFHRGHQTCNMELLIYLPQSAKRASVPTFIGLNFMGNHTIHADPEIRLCRGWVPDDPDLGVVNQRATEGSRGARSSRWPVERILERGYGIATIYCGDLDPDFDDGYQNGIHPLFYQDGQFAPQSDQWGAISAWGWGLHRAMDYFERDDQIDQMRVAVFGHSRLGKTALWAGAQDERFSIVIANNSGCMGAALSRRKFGETIGAINQRFPHWFCQNFKGYMGREEALEVDQHMLIASIAPRPVYIASAEGDLWADPRGEFLAAQAAGAVYQINGKQGLELEDMPALHTPIYNDIGYHIRSGDHDINAYDWERFLDFAQHHWG